MNLVEQVARQLGRWLIPVTLVAIVVIWLVAHFSAAPCAQVSVLFGLVEYTKRGTCPGPSTSEDDVARIKAENAGLHEQIRAATELGQLPYLVADGVWFYRGYRLRQASKLPLYAGSCPASPCFTIQLEGVVEREGTQGQEVVVTAEPQPKGSHFRVCLTMIKPKVGTEAFAQFLSSDPPSWRFFVPLVKGTQRCLCAGNQELKLTVRDSNINELALDATIREQDCSDQSPAA